MSRTNLDRRLKHLFDGTDWNVYDDHILNLGVGAPGPDLLENCCDIFQEATKHRLVSNFLVGIKLSYLYTYT